MAIAGEQLSIDFYVRNKFSVNVQADSYTVTLLRNGNVSTDAVPTVEFDNIAKRYTVTVLAPAWVVGTNIHIRFEAVVDGYDLEGTKRIGVITAAPGIGSDVANYATAADMLQRYNYDYLAEALSPRDNSVTGDLLAKVINGDNTDDDDADAVTATNTAVTRLNNFISDASAVINSYVGHKFPNFSDNPPQLKSYCCSIVAKKLFVDDEKIIEEVKSIMRYLERVADGRIKVAVLDEQDENPTVEFDSPIKQLSDNKLRGY